MLDLDSLVMALAVLVLLEGFLLTHPASLILIRLPGGGWLVRRAATYPGNGNWGWVWRPPLPFLRTAVLLEPPLTRPFQGGICFGSGSGRNSSAVVPWDEAKLRVEGEYVVANGISSAKGIRQRSADLDAKRLAKLLRLDPSARASRIRDLLLDACDSEGLRSTLAKRRQELLRVRVLSAAQTMVLLVLLPSSVLLLRMDFSVIVLLSLAYLLNLLTVIELTRLRRREGAAGSTIGCGLLVQCALYPARTSYVSSILMASAGEAFEPVCAVPWIKDRNQRIQLMRDAWVSLRYADWEAPIPERCVGEWEAYLQQYEACLRSLLTPRLPENVPLETPTEKPADAASFCPRCGIPFRQEMTRCPDCDRQLVAFVCDGRTSKTEPSIARAAFRR